MKYKTNTSSEAILNAMSQLLKAETLGMAALNAERLREGMALAYGEEHFYEVAAPLREFLASLEDAASKPVPAFRRIKTLLGEATPVIATSKNTSSVRSGHEQSGYVKYYKLPTHVMAALKQTVEVDNET